MNRFRSKKPLPAEDAAASGRDTRRWRKGKKAQEAQTPKMDLAFTLPSNDDFRTSLIMPNLSARFSMLRDQDDPSTLMGKASDDSVLSPKRKSRLGDFGFSAADNLTFVAEVRSVSSNAPRPSIADTFTSSEQDAASVSSPGTKVMDRARPADGVTTLFGGRQKVLMIPKSTSTKSLGRLVCEEDISQSTFQQHRNAERARAEAQKDAGDNSDSESLPFGLASASTSTSRAEDAVRWTAESVANRQSSATSSAASEGGQDTASTTATSISSQPLSSPRRTSRPTAPTPTVHERPAEKKRMYEQGLTQTMQDQQASAMTRLNSIQRHRAASNARSPKYATDSPTTPDPSQARAEAQHSRNSPPSQAAGSYGSQTSPPTRSSPSPAAYAQSTAIASPEPRARSNSTPGQRHWGSASPQQAAAVFQKAAAQMRVNGHDPLSSSPTVSLQSTHDTFYTDIGDSDDEDDILSEYTGKPYVGSSGNRFKPTELENIQEDSQASLGGLYAAANSQAQSDRPSGTAVRRMETPPRLQVQAQDMTTQKSPKALGGLIHQHLRNASTVSSSAFSYGDRDSDVHHLRNPSDHSSVYTTHMGRDDSIPQFDDPPKTMLRPNAVPNRINNEYTHSNPWDLDELDNDFAGTQQDRVNPLTVNGKPLGPTLSSLDTQRNNEPAKWQAEHKRELSAGTREEREAFAMELAARQKAIQENLKAVAEVDSRGNSPQPSHSGAMKAFGLLKSKASGDMAAKHEQQPGKASKLLGMGGAGSSSTSLSSMRKTSLSQDEAAAATNSSSRPSTSQRTPKLGGTHEFSRPQADREYGRMNQMPPSRQSPVIGVSKNSPALDGRSRSASQSGRAVSRQGRQVNDPERPPLASLSPRIPQGSPRESPRQSPRIAQGAGRAEDTWKSAGPRTQPGGSSPQTHQGPAGLRLTPTITASPPAQNGAFAQGAPPTARHPTLQSPPMPSEGQQATPRPPMPHPSQDHYSPSPITKQPGAILRKKTVVKSDISEPTLISSTSNVDTVELPPGASLKNGMEVPGFAPPTSRRRKLFGRREEHAEPAMPSAPSNRYPNPGAPPPVPSANAVSQRIPSRGQTSGKSGMF